MTAGRSIDLPRLPFVGIRWILGVILIASVAEIIIREVLREPDVASYADYALCIVVAFVSLLGQRRATVAVESKLRELGFPVAARGAKANPPPAFLWNRSVATTRSGMMALAVIFVLFPVIPAVSWLFREGRWPHNPPALTWQSMKEFELLALGAAAAIVVCYLVRRIDASLARWEKVRKQFSQFPGGASAALRRWPSVLFGMDWDSRSGALREAWVASGLSTPAADPSYRALEQIVRWAHQADRIESFRERQLYGHALRRLAWRYALALDPTLANYT